MFNIASISLAFLLFFANPGAFPVHEPNSNVENKLNTFTETFCRNIFNDCELYGKLDYAVYRRAIRGISQIPAPRKDILTIIDYTKPSDERRFFVIDLVHHRLLYQTLVAHGKNSGGATCTRFSNRPGSLESSPGFFLTAETYEGAHGYSLRLDGMEPGINDKARARDIVVHGADYVSQRYIDHYGYIGRSFGCLALPTDISSRIIDLIKGGTCLYINTDNRDYTEHTQIRN